MREELTELLLQYLEETGKTEEFKEWLSDAGYDPDETINGQNT